MLKNMCNNSKYETSQNSIKWAALTCADGQTDTKKLSLFTRWGNNTTVITCRLVRSVTEENCTLVTRPTKWLTLFCQQKCHTDCTGIKLKHLCHSHTTNTYSAPPKYLLTFHGKKNLYSSTELKCYNIYRCPFYCDPEHNNFITQKSCIHCTSHDSCQAHGQYVLYKQTSYTLQSNFNVILIYFY